MTSGGRPHRRPARVEWKGGKVGYRSLAVDSCAIYAKTQGDTLNTVIRHMGPPPPQNDKGRMHTCSVILMTDG